MINKIIDTEIKYIECFSRRNDLDNCIRFHDKHLEEMYAFNVTKIKRFMDVRQLNKVIENERKFISKKKKDYLLIDLDYEVRTEQLSCMPEKVYEQVYLVKEILKKETVELNSNEVIEKAVSFHHYEDIRELNIKDKGHVWGRGFTNKRTYRKLEIYEKSGIIQPYILYVNNFPIGFCEVMLNEDIAKIEDFYILKEYRNKGYGAKLLNYSINQALKNNIKFVYVAADSDKITEKIYRNLGFSKKYKKMQLLY